MLCPLPGCRSLVLSEQSWGRGTLKPELASAGGRNGGLLVSSRDLHAAVYLCVPYC